MDAHLITPPQTEQPASSREPRWLMTTEEVAALLRVEADTLVTWRCREHKELPFVKVGRLVRYRRADVDAYINERLTAA